MRLGWVLAVVALLALVPGARADPGVTQPEPGKSLAQWTFSNPANYSLANASFGPGGASLPWVSATLKDKSAGDFGLALTQVNVDLGSQPGEVLIADTSMPGPLQTVDAANAPSDVSDNFLWASQAGTNFGGSPNLFVGFWGANVWTRSIVGFPVIGLPSNATVRSAALRLYMEGAASNDSMAVGIYRITSPWTEFGSTWDSEDGAIPWNSTANGTGGGDFDPALLDAVSGITDLSGWYSWNVSAAVGAWWSGATPNHGFLLRQVDDDTRNPLGQKVFDSSDSTNASRRPRLTIGYTTPSSAGVLESRILDPGGRSLWATISWDTVLPAGTSVAFQTRSGDSAFVDGTWSPWSAVYPTSGQPVVSPTSRYIQYRIRLFTPSSQSPSLLEVAVGFVRHPAIGSVTTEPFATVGTGAWSTVTMNASRPAATDATLAYSVDGGSSWLPVASGDDVSGAPFGAIRFQISLMTSNTTESPSVSRIALWFVTSSGPGGLSGFVYWVPLLALLGIAIWFIVGRALRVPFRPTDAFLIHEDGRLLARASQGDSALRDELATSGMLTVVAGFVKDSFAPGSGGAGELKSLQVDNRHVSIAKDAFLYLAIVSTGEPPRSLRDSMDDFLAALRAVSGPALAAWDGFRDRLADVESQLSAFLEKLGSGRSGKDSQP